MPNQFHRQSSICGLLLSEKPRQVGEIKQQPQALAISLGG